MKQLLIIRGHLQVFFARFEVYIVPAIKFLLIFILLSMVNSQIGKLDLINSFPAVLVVALLCSFLPGSMMVFVSALFILGHMYALGIECLIAGVVYFSLIYIVYFRFAPKDYYVVLLLPLLAAMKMPFAVAVGAGLLATPVSAVAIACGVAVIHLVTFISSNATAITAMADDEMMAKIRYLIDGIIQNKMVYVMAASYCVTVIVVYCIRRLKVDFAWRISIVAGLVIGALIYVAGAIYVNYRFSVISFILGLIGSYILMEVLTFFKFNVDYARVENVQFEDDEYYYYVKAIPKISVSKPKKKVKRITK